MGYFDSGGSLLLAWLGKSWQAGVGGRFWIAPYDGFWLLMWLGKSGQAGTGGRSDRIGRCFGCDGSVLLAWLVESWQAGYGERFGKRSWEGVRDSCWRRQGVVYCQGASAGERVDGVHDVR